MSAYNQEFNSDNIVLRYVIVATLAELREKVYFYNRISEDEQVKIQLPFYYSVSGNERFLLDVFKFDEQYDDKKTNFMWIHCWNEFSYFLSSIGHNSYTFTTFTTTFSFLFFFLYEKNNTRRRVSCFI